MEWKDGDIFWWRYKEGKQPTFGHDPYWCKAMKGVVKNGRLVDAYWSSESTSFSAEEAAERLDLEYKGNINEMEPIQHYEVRYYEDADVVDMTHSNNTKATCYRRKGAQRSMSKALAVLHEKRQQAKSELDMALHRLECLARDEALIRGGHIPLEHLGY